MVYAPPGASTTLAAEKLAQPRLLPDVGSRMVLPPAATAPLAESTPASVVARLHIAVEPYRLSPPF
jgi:hypothetical protein